MRIALINTFPRQPYHSNLEFIRKFSIAAISCGHETFEVEVSDQILQYKPDFVLSTHDLSPKLTPYFTVGVIWKSPLEYAQNPRSMRAIRSYDAYLTASKDNHHFLDSMEHASGIYKPRGDFDFLPSTAGIFNGAEYNKKLSLCFIGTNEKDDFKSSLIKKISSVVPLSIYGPKENWINYKNEYKNPIPFDGFSLVETLAGHGIALCIHNRKSSKEGFVSQRTLEAAAAGCLLIVDDLVDAKKIFGNSIFYIDPDADQTEIALEVKNICDWANANPDAAMEKRKRSKEIFDQGYTLEKIIEKTCKFVEKAKIECAENERIAVHLLKKLHLSSEKSALDSPLVDVIMRTGGRDIESIKRALNSLRTQTEGIYRVLLIDYKGRSDIQELAEISATDKLSIKYIRCEDTGARSTSLWTGLKCVEAPFFAILDDDDTLSPDHFAALFATAAKHPDHNLYYSGAIRLEEATDQYFHAENYNGSMSGVVEEKRELVFLEPFNLARLIAADNYITSNSYIARTSALDERTLTDPHLVVGEDMYLLLMLARKRSFLCNNRPTSYWHWRSNSIDNSMIGVQQNTWASEGSRLLIRLDQEVFPNSLTFGAMRVISKPGEEGFWKPSASVRKKSSDA